jgi:hypothetical protein
MLRWLSSEFDNGRVCALEIFRCLLTGTNKVSESYQTVVGRLVVTARNAVGGDLRAGMRA